jgi:hypothetical protein
VKSLVHEYNNVIATQQIGTIEIEAVFGRLCFGDTHRFDDTLPICVMNKLLTLLLSFQYWDSVSDWYLVYDYYSTNQSNVTVSYENKVQSVTQITQQTVSSKDCSYCQDSSSPWKLRENLIRVNLNLKQDCKHIDELTEIQSVKISAKKYFVVRSSSLPSVSFRFELTQYWSGTQLSQAEGSMKQDVPQCTFGCGIINLPSQLTDSQQFLLFTSLLLKMQDFLDIPIYTGLLQSKEKKNPALTTFELV